MLSIIHREIKVSSFHSKEKFYYEVNNSIKDENIKVILRSGSCFNVLHGAVIENDSLVTIQSSSFISSMNEVKTPPFN
jgi:hypothetical protein